MAHDSAKGNPASKRIGNAKRKARRERCWLRGQKRKQENAKLVSQREADNRALRVDGKPTAWELASAQRWARRHKDIQSPTLKGST